MKYKDHPLIIRLEKLVALLANNPKAFAGLMGLKRASMLYNYLNGKNLPSVEFLLLLLEKFPYVRAEWLMRGEGDVTTKKGRKKISPRSLEDIEAELDVLRKQIRDLGR